MGKTYKDQNKFDDKQNQKGKKYKFPRVPSIVKRSEPFEDKRRKNKHYEDWLDEDDPMVVDPVVAPPDPSDDDYFVNEDVTL